MNPRQRKETISLNIPATRIQSLGKEATGGHFSQMGLLGPAQEQKSPQSESRGYPCSWPPGPAELGMLDSGK